MIKACKRKSNIQKSFEENFVVWSDKFACLSLNNIISDSPKSVLISSTSWQLVPATPEHTKRLLIVIKYIFLFVILLGDRRFSEVPDDRKSLSQIKDKCRKQIKAYTRKTVSSHFSNILTKTECPLLMLQNIRTHFRTF